MSRIRSTACLLAAILVLADGASAQNPPDSVISLPAIDVLSSILTVMGPTVASGVPARVHVIADDGIRATRPRLLADVLIAVPGVSLYDDLGSAYKTTLLMRGFAASPVVGLPQGISVFVDGVSVNEPDAGQVNFDLLPLRHVARIETMAGSASLLGPHTLGGAVNLITYRGGGPFGGAIELVGGSHGQLGVTAQVDGAVGGWSYYVGGGHDQEGGWRQLTEAVGNHGILSVSRGGEERGIRLQAFAASSNAETAGSLPHSVYVEHPDSNLSAGDFEDVRQIHAAVSGYAVSGAGRVAIRIHARASDAERFNVNQIKDPDVRSFAENRTLGLTGDWRREERALGGILDLRLGASIAMHRTSVRIFAERLDPGLTTDVDAPIREGAMFATGGLTRGRASLFGSGRLDVVRIPFRNRLNPVRDTTSTFVRLSPRIGLSITVGENASLYASAGQSFRAPAVIELACADPQEPCPLPFALGDDPPLDPVTATTWEIGGRWATAGLALGGSAYTTEVRNDIFLLPYDDEDEQEQSTIDGYFANIERTHRNGLEFDASYTARAGHRLSAAYAWTRATFGVSGIELFSIRQEAGGENEIERGDHLPLIPHHTLTISADAALPRGLGAGVDVRYVGERRLRGDEANNEAPIEPHTLVRLRAGWSAGSWGLHAVIDNVFDDRYAAFGTFNFNQGAGNALERFFTPAEPRTIRLMLRREFGAT